MGKKSKRKAAKAAAAASTAVVPLGLGPRPDEIVCTNEDPNVCILCSAELGYEIVNINLCCGTRVCSICYERAGERCDYCGVVTRTRCIATAQVKKRAKEGFPWACNFLAHLYSKGAPPTVEHSDWNAFFWYEKAAKMDHPDACHSLGTMYARGAGCRRNLDMAQDLFEKAARLAPEDPDLMARVRDSQCGVAMLYFQDEEKFDRAISVLTPLAEGGMGRAQYFLGFIFDKNDENQSARWWFNTCSENSEGPLYAMRACLREQKIPLARFWYSYVSSDVDSLVGAEIELLREGHEALCDLRQTCATCDTELDRTNRKLCAGCKATCYCSVECQKAHWNESGGHRYQCKEASAFHDEMKRKHISEAISKK